MHAHKYTHAHTQQHTHLVTFVHTHAYVLSHTLKYTDTGEQAHSYVYAHNAHTHAHTQRHTNTLPLLLWTTFPKMLRMMRRTQNHYLDKNSLWVGILEGPLCLPLHREICEGETMPFI